MLNRFIGLLRNRNNQPDPAAQADAPVKAPDAAQPDADIPALICDARLGFVVEETSLDELTPDQLEAFGISPSLKL